MARPGMRDPERDLYWNPALPGVPPVAPPDAAPRMGGVEAPAYGADDHAPTLAERYGAPLAPRQPVQAPAPQLDRGSVGRSMLGNAQTALTGAATDAIDRASRMDEPGDAPIYQPDAVDVLGGALGGFIGQFGTSPREQRWNRQQDADAADRREKRQQLRDQAQFGNWLAQANMREQQLEARKEALGQGAERVDLAKRKQAGIDEDRDWRLDPEKASKTREFVLRQANGRVTPEELDGMSNAELRGVMTMLNREAERGHAGEDTAIAARKAGATATASTIGRETAARPFDIDKENRAELRAARAAELANEKLAKAKFPEQAAAYAKDTENDLTILGLVNDFDAKNPPGKPIVGTGFVQGWTPDMFSNEQALDNRSLLKLINEKWARSQSGAAISMTEEERFKVQSGTSETATDAQVRVAMRTLKSALTRYARARAVGQEDAATEVARAYGVDLGLGARKTRGAASRPSKAAPKALSFDPSDPLGGL